VPAPLHKNVLATHQIAPSALHQRYITEQASLNGAGSLLALHDHLQSTGLIKPARLFWHLTETQGNHRMTDTNKWKQRLHNERKQNFDSTPGGS
jgi:hypothetical protein